jgi:hypothetical protein
MSRERCAQFLGVSLRTVRYWDAGRSRVPWSAVRLLRLLRGGDLGGLHDAWTGWYLNPRTAELVSPNGYSFQPGQMAAWPLICEQARFWRRGYDHRVAGGVGAVAPALTLQPVAGEAVSDNAAATFSPSEAAVTPTALVSRLPGSDFVASQAADMAVAVGCLDPSEVAAATRSGAGLVLLKTSDMLVSQTRFFRHLRGASCAAAF